MILPENLTEADFHKYPSGSLACGLRWNIDTDLGVENHECYQFNSLEKLLEAYNSFIKMDYSCDAGAVLKVEIVTYKPGYKNMKVLSRFTRERRH